MNPARKPFIERARQQLQHLSPMSRRRAGVQQRWSDFFLMVKREIKQLKSIEERLSKQQKKAELETAKSQLIELNNILEQARILFRGKTKK